MSDVNPIIQGMADKWEDSMVELAENDPQAFLAEMRRLNGPDWKPETSMNSASEMSNSSPE